MDHCLDLFKCKVFAIKNVTKGHSVASPSTSLQCILKDGFADLPWESDLARLVRVSFVRVIVTVLLVAVWLPASSHVLLESAGLIHQHDESHDHDGHHHAEPGDAHDHDADNHDAADGHCLIHSAKVQFSKPGSLAFASHLIVALMATAHDQRAKDVPLGPSPPGVAPPELSPRWQFSSRTALPVRAPSFLS